jgi:hypothetical protein
MYVFLDLHSATIVVSQVLSIVFLLYSESTEMHLELFKAQ